jgi:hypothetical protein
MWVEHGGQRVAADAPAEVVDVLSVSKLAKKLSAVALAPGGVGPG